MFACFAPRTGGTANLQAAGKRRSWRRTISLGAEVRHLGNVFRVSSKSAWYSEIAEAWRDGALVAVLWAAPWLSVSLEADPIFENMALQNSGQSVRFLRVDMDQLPELSQEYGVLTLPCIMLLSEGLVVGRVVGLANMQGLPELLHQYQAVLPTTPSFTSAHLPLSPPAAEDPSSPVSFESVPSSSDYPSEAAETLSVSERKLKAADDTYLHVNRWPSPTRRCTLVAPFQQEVGRLGNLSMGPAAAF